MGLLGGCLSFCASGFPTVLGLGFLKSFHSEKLEGMASTQIDSDCDEVVDGYAKSTRQVLEG